MKIATSARTYVQNIVDAVVTAAIGMRITMRYLLQKPITVQYPDERLPMPERSKGIHYLEQEKCLECQACAKACPVGCIEIEAIKHGKEREFVKFTVNYQKCLFCELCILPCPSDCIHLGPEFAFVVTDRRELVHNLLSYRGMAREAVTRMIEAEKKKAEKEAAKKAAAAKKKAEAGADEGEKPAKRASKKPDEDAEDGKEG